MKFLIPVFFLISATQESCIKQIPIWNKKVYKADHVDQTIKRKQDGEVIPTSDPKFGEFICIRQESFDCLTETYILNCQKWAKQSECGLKDEP